MLAFLKQVAKAHPRVKLHVVVDNYATHSHPNVKAWLARQPRITLHFTPDLTAAIRTFIDADNEGCRPFAWTKTADQVLDKANRSPRDLQ